MAALAALVGCRRAPESGVESEPAPVAVRVAPLVWVESPSFLELPATVVPRERARLAARVPGRVAVLEAELGRSVAAGELLVRLEAPELEARRRQAEAARDQAQRDLTRDQGLLERGAVSPEVVRAGEDRLRMAAAGLEEAATLLGYTVIRAPFPGVVVERPVHVGDLALPGGALLTLEGRALQVEVAVPERLPQVALGGAIALVVEGETLAAEVLELSPAANPDSRSRLAKLVVDPALPLRSGQFVRVAWPSGQTRELLVPAGAVARWGQMERVWVREGDRARLRLVRTGARRPAGLAVVAGLSGGEAVMLDPPASLVDGVRVEVLP